MAWGFVPATQHNALQHSKACRNLSSPCSQPPTLTAVATWQNERRAFAFFPLQARVAERFFGALGRAGVSVLAIAQVHSMHSFRVKYQPHRRGGPPQRPTKPGVGADRTRRGRGVDAGASGRRMQGSNELNISAVVTQGDATKSLRAVRDAPMHADQR